VSSVKTDELIVQREILNNGICYAKEINTCVLYVSIQVTWKFFFFFFLQGVME
jgi:hypothetical protein